MVRWNLSTFRACSLWAGDDPILPQGDWREGHGNQTSTVEVQATALGDPSGWEGKRQQAREPKITSAFAARGSLTPLQVHAEPSAQAPLSSVPPVESHWPQGGERGLLCPLALPCPVPHSLPSPVRKTGHKGEARVAPGRALPTNWVPDPTQNTH